MQRIQFQGCNAISASDKFTLIVAEMPAERQKKDLRNFEGNLVVAGTSEF